MMHEGYKKMLFEKKQLKHKIKRLEIKSHQLGIFKVNKFLYQFKKISDIYLMMELMTYHIGIKILNEK